MDIRALIQSGFSLKDETLLQQLTDLAYLRKLKKGEQPVRIGVPLSELMFLADGCVRCFFRDTGNEEFTDCFINQPAYPIFTPHLDRPQECTVEAVCATTLLCLPLEPLVSLMNTNLELMRVHNDLLNRALFFHWQGKVMYRQYNAAQRYQWFLTTYPGLEEQVSSRHIASLLGITTVTLSRLRRQRRENPEKFQSPLPPLQNI